MSTEDTKALKISSETSNRGRDIAKFMPLVEMIVKKLVRTNSNQMLTYDEMINTGLLSVNKLIEKARATKDTEFNSSYIAQSIKWSINDEIRSRQAWYGVKKTAPKVKELDPTEITEVKSIDDARQAVFEVIMSVDSMGEDGTGLEVADPNSPEHLEHLELLSMKNSLKKSVSKLPDNLRQVIEMRFYKNLSGNEVAQKMEVTPSRVSHMIKEATRKLKLLMTAEGYSTTM